MLFSCAAARSAAGVVLAATLTTSAALASPFAVEVVSYEPGSNAGGFTNDAAALGAPTAGLTPFSPSFSGDDLVSVGFGGHLTLRLGTAATDAATNPFGIDLIVFSNEAFLDSSFPDGFTGDATLFGQVFGAEAPAIIELSADGDTWVSIGPRQLDFWPTFTRPGGDPTSPLDPTLTIDDFDNLDLDGLAALYGSSAGGLGIDLAGTGLASASYIRFSNTDDTFGAFEIDAVAVVPAAPTLGVLLAGVALVGRRRR
jgi:hypothetical protein